jgi:hypothetical protein
MNPSQSFKLILIRVGPMASPSLVHHSEYSARPNYDVRPYCFRCCYNPHAYNISSDPPERTNR